MKKSYKRHKEEKGGGGGCGFNFYASLLGRNLKTWGGSLPPAREGGGGRGICRKQRDAHDGRREGKGNLLFNNKKITPPCRKKGFASI